MRKSLAKLIEELDSNIWNYRHEENQLEKPDFSDGTCKKFISDYFGIAGKGTIELVELNIIIPDFPKTEHTSSIFFLGTILFNEFFKNIFPKVSGTTFSGYDKFSFLWFLTSLFHDIANNFELSEKCIFDYNSYEKLKSKGYSLK